MTEWTPYPDRPGVVGTLLRSGRVMAPHGLAPRRLVVHLPDSAAEHERRYPVVYAHDGQNLFDPAASYAGEWGCDETLAVLAGEGIEAIVVGIPNAGDARVDEYGPWRHQGRGGKGEAYLDFVAGTIKPIIDAAFPTRPERDHTAILGSSMGGVISLYAYVARSDVFGMAGVISPAFLYAPGETLPWLAASSIPAGKVYLDVGTNEFPEDAATSRTYVDDARAVRSVLEAAGLGLHYVEEVGAVHHETAWARRLPGALRFLLGPAHA